MNLDDLRKEINDIDGQMLQLFLKRMRYAKALPFTRKSTTSPFCRRAESSR